MLRFEDCLPTSKCIALSSTACSRSGIIVALTDRHGIEIKGQG